MSESVVAKSSGGSDKKLGSASEPCPFGRQEAQLVVMIATYGGLLDGCEVKVTDAKGKTQTARSLALFKDLAAGQAKVEVVLTLAQAALYVPQTVNVTISSDPSRRAAQVMMRLPSVSTEARPVIRSQRIHTSFEGRNKKAVPLEFKLLVESGNPESLSGAIYTIQRSRPGVMVFSDRLCSSELVFNKDVARLDPWASRLVDEEISLWAVPLDQEPFSLTFAIAKKTQQSTVVPGPPAVWTLKKGIEFLEGPGRFLDLVDGFKSVADIVGSVKRVRTLAALCDMKTEQFANFAIKRFFIKNGVLEQQVVISIDGQKVKLTHPVAAGKVPLFYSDFIVDRSGPKFLGALDADVAVETLMYKDACISTLLAKLKEEGKAQAFDPDLIQSVRDLAVRRLDGLSKRTPNAFTDLNDGEVLAATSLFEQKHMAQRELSDFDLTARETDTLALAIGLELKKKIPDLQEAFILEIGRITWSQGGPIETAKVKAAHDASGGDPAKALKAYLAAIAADEQYVLKKSYAKMGYVGKRYYHILIHEVGAEACKLLAHSEPEVDNFYGLGIPYMGPQVEEKPDGTLQYTRELFEIGDIITDEASHYGTVFSHNANIKKSLADAGLGFDGFDARKNLRDNARAALEKKKNAGVLAAYREREAFIDTMLMFEQVAKKEAQAQLFKADFKAHKGTPKGDKAGEKLMGNVSDVSQFLYGADIAARVAKSDGRDADARRMEAFKEVVMLSCCIAMSRWGITAQNLDGVTDTAGQVTDELFAASINRRSYAFQDDFDAPRVHCEWAKIDKVIAGQRLKDFKGEMGPIWDFLHGQKTHFANMDALIAAIRAKGDLVAPKKAVRAELAKVLAKLVNLKAQVGGDEQVFLDALTAQCEESAQFQVTRVPG